MDDASSYVGEHRTIYGLEISNHVLRQMIDAIEEDSDSDTSLYEFADSRAETAMLLLEKTDSLTTNFLREERHVEAIRGTEAKLDPHLWRRLNGKVRVQTVSMALVLCLNIGIDPPDPEPWPEQRPMMEAWVHPGGWSPDKAILAIAFELQQAYARLQPRARCKYTTKSTKEDIMMLCQSMRRHASDGRVLFHYNGHGVPRPTKHGDLWVFNKAVTQYIPLSINDLMDWLGAPTIYVWDCSSAASCINAFHGFGEQKRSTWMHEFEEYKEQVDEIHPENVSHMSPYDEAELYGFKLPPNFQDCVHLAACREDERLPQDPRVPADLFAACLTTPIKASILWYMIKKDVREKYPDNLLDCIPGQIGDRRTLLGELNFIYSGIADAIAWNSLPPELFQRLFRQDHVLATMFRSYLLAEKVLEHFGCHTRSYPSLPAMAAHPLWENWEMSLDYAIDYLDKFMYSASPANQCLYVSNQLFTVTRRRQDFLDLAEAERAFPEEGLHFFADQMRTFRTWLNGFHDLVRPPIQLPIVVQGLFNMEQRADALELLSRFLDLGSHAIEHSLSVGIFSFIVALLQTTQRDLKPWLAFTWAKILAVEREINEELYIEIDNKDQEIGFYRPEGKDLRILYFIQILNDPSIGARQKVVVSYILAMLNSDIARRYLTERNFITDCTELLVDPKAKNVHLLRCWLNLTMGSLWRDYNAARWQSIRITGYQKVIADLTNESAEARACACYALGSLMKNHSHTNEHATVIDGECATALLAACLFDGSALVREEMCLALQYFVVDFVEVLAKYYVRLVDQCKMDFVDEMLVDYELSREELRTRTISETSADEAPPPKATSSRRRLLSNRTPAPRKPDVYFATSGPSEREMRFRTRMNRQIASLETHQFMDSFNRVLLGLMRACLDPMIKIGDLGQMLVRAIENAAIEYRAAIERRLLASARLHAFNINGKASGDNPAPPRKTSVFELRRELPPLTSPPRHHSLNLASDEASEMTSGLGNSSTLDVISPASSRKSSLRDSAVRKSSSAARPARTPLSPNNKIDLMAAPTVAIEFLLWRKEMSDDPSNLSMKDFNPNSIIAKDHTFIPKRTVAGRIGGSEFKAPRPHPKANEIFPIYEPLVVNKLISWLGKCFAEPCISLVLCERECDVLGDRLNTAHHPSRFQQDEDARLKKLAAEEMVTVVKGFTTLPRSGMRRATKQIIEPNVQLMTVKTESPVLASSFSRLHPQFYTTDGAYVYAYKYEDRQCHEAFRWHNHAGNGLMEAACFLETINPMGNEMVLVGSKNSIVRIFDLSYDGETGRRLPLAPKMVSAFQSLGNVMRNPLNYVKSSKTPAVYSWNQPSGKLAIAGSARAVRLWDAHCERQSYEILYEYAREGTMTAVANDIGASQLFGVGFRDGAARVYDQRMQAKEARIFITPSVGSRVVSMQLHTDPGAQTKLCVGHADGGIQIFEPRMSKDPVLCLGHEKKYSQQFPMHDRMSHFAVHSDGQKMAATVLRENYEVELFDMSGKVLTRVHQNDAENRRIARPTSLSLHPIRPLIGLGTADNCFSVYGVGIR
ncbi:unnamed protein product, partial [Mesorhabditis spiculigera]